MAGEQNADLRALLSTPIFDPLLDEIVAPILSEPPFQPVPGLINSRWLPLPIRPQFILRSGAVNHLTPEGKQTLVDLEIKSIFDLRSLKERTAEPDPEIEGIEGKWEPSTLDNDTSAEAQSQQEDASNFSFVKMYLDTLETHKVGFKTVLLHVRDHPYHPILFHCTAGKDRTGILAALLLSIAGADPEVIDHDYALTRIGTEPARELLTKKLFRGKPINFEDPLLRAYANMPLDAMSQTLAALAEKYDGGAEGYVKEELGFTEKDVGTIRKNLSA